VRKSKVLAKIRAGQPARIAMLGYFLPPFIAHAAHLGYDGIWLDLEHRPMDSREVQALLAFFHLYDIDCLVRTPTREKSQLYRYLEDGATGIIVPHVSDVEVARALVQAVKFPPVGDRGIEGHSLESNFGLDIAASRDLLVEHAQRETCLILQIETPTGLAAVDDIAALPGVDGLYIGPSDLGIRMSRLPEQQQVSFDDTLRRVAAACARSSKFWGSMPRVADDLRQHYQRGSRLLLWGIDARIIRDGLAQNAQELRALLET
jgi:2-keto-3-deoxy-L-rhamnonate aldolase RhmA